MSGTRADADLELIEQLDWQPACEHTAHGSTHPGDESAALVIRRRCPACDRRRTFFICMPGFRFHAMGQWMRCPCGHRGHWTDFWTSVESLR